METRIIPLQTALDLLHACVAVEANGELCRPMFPDSDDPHDRDVFLLTAHFTFRAGDNTTVQARPDGFVLQSVGGTRVLVMPLMGCMGLGSSPH